MSRVVVVFHSASGRTQALADAVVRGAARGGADAEAIDVATARAEPNRLVAADAIVFGAPTYMGSASAAFKAFMDSTAAVWALQGWRDKLAAGFTHSAAPSGDKLGTLVQLATFAAQHGMVWVGLGLPPTYAGEELNADDTNRLGSHLGAMAQSRPGTALPTSDLRTAEHLGLRVADAARRWGRVPILASSAEQRHPATREWRFPPERPPSLFERVNVRELAARPDRFEHHLLVIASVGGAQWELVTASEPLAFGHVNLSDEFAVALPTGDGIVDRFPLRTFVSDPSTGDDVGRYNHAGGDLVLHPDGYLHWPGRLRPPFEPFEFPDGMRRCGLSLVYCAAAATPPAALALTVPDLRRADAKAYVSPAPRLGLVPLGAAEGIVARIGMTSVEALVQPTSIEPPRGGFVLVLQASEGAGYAEGDLIRIGERMRLPGTGMERALLFSSTEAAPDAVPDSWARLPTPPFAPVEDQPRGALPLTLGPITFTESTAATVRVALYDAVAEVPRHWLARMLFRVALHRCQLGYVETYGGFFIADGGLGLGEHSGDPEIQLGLRLRGARVSCGISRHVALATLERIYRAVAPIRYTERLH